MISLNFNTVNRRLMIDHFGPYYVSTADDELMLRFAEFMKHFSGSLASCQDRPLQITNNVRVQITYQNPQGCLLGVTAGKLRTLQTFIVVPDVLSKFSMILNVFFFR